MLIQHIHGRRLVLIILLILASVGIIHAQDDTVVLDTLTILEDGDVVDGLFAEELNTQLYAFYASAGDEVTVTMLQAEADDLDPFLVLLDASGAVLAMDDDSGAEFLSAEITDFDVPADGAYLILATSLRFLEGTDIAQDDLSYTVSIAGNTLPDDAVDNEIEIAAPTLTYGLVVQSESSEVSPAAFFVFDGVAGDVVNVAVESDEFPTVLHIFDPSGTRLAIDPSAIVSLELPDDGAYLILATDVFFYEAMQDDTFFIGGVFVLSLDGS